MSAADHQNAVKSTQRLLSNTALSASKKNMRVSFSIEVEDVFLLSALQTIGQLLAPQGSELERAIASAYRAAAAAAAANTHSNAKASTPDQHTDDQHGPDTYDQEQEAAFQACETLDELEVDEESTTTTAEPDVKPKRRRRTKAEIEADKLKEQGLSQPELPLEDPVNTTAPPEVTQAVEVVPASPEVEKAVKDIMQEQAKVAFPHPHDFLRAAYAADKVKARKTCSDFLEEIRAQHPERNVAAMQDLKDEEFQILCQRIVDAGIAPLPE